MQLANGSLRLALVLALAFTSILLKMVPIITKEKIDQILEAGEDIALVVLSLVKDFSGAFPPLQLAATGAFFIATNVKVSSGYPKHQSTSLLTTHIRASGRARTTGTSSETMTRMCLP